MRRGGILRSIGTRWRKKSPLLAQKAREKWGTQRLYPPVRFVALAASGQECPLHMEIR